MLWSFLSGGQITEGTGVIVSTRGDPPPLAKETAAGGPGAAAIPTFGQSRTVTSSITTVPLPPATVVARFNVNSVPAWATWQAPAVIAWSTVILPVLSVANTRPVVEPPASWRYVPWVMSARGLDVQSLSVPVRCRITCTPRTPVNPGGVGTAVMVTGTCRQASVEVQAAEVGVAAITAAARAVPGGAPANAMHARQNASRRTVG